jgi:AcrR family transcriptional regulator
MSGSGAEPKGGAGDEFPRPPLPRGRRRLTPEEVAEDQRRRLLSAMAESVAIHGYAASSVARVIELAGVSRGTFYELFENRHECLLAAYDAAFASFSAAIEEACAGASPWPDRAAAAIAAAVRFAAACPEQARLLALDTAAADLEAAGRAIAGGDRLAELLGGGREHNTKSRSLPDVTERALVGAVSSVINGRLLSGEPLDDLEPQLVQLVLTPYIGPAAAARQAAKVGRGSLGGEAPAVET